MLNHSQWVASGIQTRGSLNKTLLLEVFCLISLCLTARAPDTCREKMEKVSPTFTVSGVSRVLALTSFKAIFHHVAIQPCCPDLVWWPPLHCHRGVSHTVHCQHRWGAGNSWGKQGTLGYKDLRLWFVFLWFSTTGDRLSCLPGWFPNKDHTRRSMNLIPCLLTAWPRDKLLLLSREGQTAVAARAERLGAVNSTTAGIFWEEGSMLEL